MRLEEETYTEIKSKVYERKGMKTRTPESKGKVCKNQHLNIIRTRGLLFNSLGVRWKYLQKISSLKETDVKGSDSQTPQRVSKTSTCAQKYPLYFQMQNMLEKECHAGIYKEL